MSSSSVQIRAFVFTDIVGSTRLKKMMPGRDNTERNGRFTQTILKPHREHIESTLDRFSGTLVSSQGDGHFLAFGSPIDAVLWSIAVEQAHEKQPSQAAASGRPEGTVTAITVPEGPVRTVIAPSMASTISRAT